MITPTPLPTPTATPQPTPTAIGTATKAPLSPSPILDDKTEEPEEKDLLNLSLYSDFRIC